MLKVRIETKNQSFEGNLEGELRYLLQKVIVKINNGETAGQLLDSNGNNTGSYKLTK